MRKTYLLWFAILAFLVIGCREELTTVENSATDERTELFFKNSLNRASKNFNQVSGQIAHLKSINSKNEFISKLSDQKGLPKWDFSLHSKKKGHDKSGRTTSTEDVLVVPLQEDNNNYLSSLLYIENPDSANPFIYTVTNLELYDFVHNSNIDAHIRETVLSTFLYFDDKIYDNQDFAHLPADLYPDVPLEAGKTTKSFEAEFSEDTETDPQGLHYNTICVISNHCTRTGPCASGICDQCNLCVSQACYTVGGPGGSTGTGDGDGDGSPGDGDGGEGGGSGTGGECSRGGWYRVVPPGDCGGGGDGNTPPNPKCETSNTSITNANNILKNPEVQTKMDAVLKSKRNAPVEYAVSVGKNSNGSYSVTPPKEGGIDSGTVPPVLSGNYVADGHTHPDGHYGTPSGGDFYNFILRFPNNPYLESRFVYGSYFGDAEVYALVVYDKNIAQNFVNTYPKSTNYDENTHMFLSNSTLGNAYNEAITYANVGTYQNDSDESYSSSAMAMAYVLDRFNTGISLAKVDADGNLKRINVTKEPIVVSGSNGIPKSGLKITKCP